MRHNPGTWHNCSQVKLTSEELCQGTNCKTKYKLENEYPLGNNPDGVTWEQWCLSHLGTNVPMSLGSNFASVSWPQLCLSNLRKIVPVPLEDNHVSVN